MAQVHAKPNSAKLKGVIFERLSTSILCSNSMTAVLMFWARAFVGSKTITTLWPWVSEFTWHWSTRWLVDTILMVGEMLNIWGESLLKGREALVCRQCRNASTWTVGWQIRICGTLGPRTRIGRFFRILVSLYRLKFLCTLTTSFETSAGFQGYFGISRQR